MAKLGQARDGGGGAIWLIALAVLGAALVGGWFYLHRRAEQTMVTEETGCLQNAAAPRAAMFMIDSTDRLSPETAKHVIDTIKQDAAALPRFSRVILVPFDDDTARPLKPIFSKCLPGSGKDAGIDENARFLEIARHEFDQSLDKLEDTLTGLPPSKTSPISTQIVRAASDPVLEWKGAKRTLVLLSDGLESSIYWTRTLKLPEPPHGLLDGVDVEYVELGNEKAGKLQSDQMRQQWRSWFEKAGGDVRMTAPGYAAT